MSRTFSLVDLFAGCGGLTSGFVATGVFEPVHAVENDLQAAATYATNFGDHLFVGNMEERVAGSWPRADVVVGGPPCQGFSALGRRDPDDPRNRLWRPYVTALKRMRPAFFVIENVPQFLNSSELRQLSAECERGGQLEGYALETHLLNAAHYGVAQQRRRAVLIGRRRELDPLGPPPRHDGVATVGDALPAWLQAQPCASNFPLSRLVYRGVEVNGALGLKELHVTRPLSDIWRRRIQAVPPGGSRTDLPDNLLLPCWRANRSSATDVLGRLRWDRPSVTIRTGFFRPEKGRFVHPDQDRAITHAEAAILQGFDESFQWCGSSAAVARQIGNAVPPPLAEAIAKHLASRLS